MIKRYRIAGIILYIIGLLFILLMLAKGLHIISIENDRVFALVIFISFVFPAIGFRLIRKSKRFNKSANHDRF